MASLRLTTDETRELMQEKGSLRLDVDLGTPYHEPGAKYAVAKVPDGSVLILVDETSDTKEILFDNR